MHSDGPRSVWQLITGFRNTQLLYVAAKLGLADQLAGGAKSAVEIAEEVRAHPDALYRIMRALTVVGIFEQGTDGRFMLNARGELLRSDAPGSMRNIAVLYGEEWLWRSYGNMLHSVVTGQPAFPETHGQTFYEFLDQHASAGVVFQTAMDSFSKNEAAVIVDSYPFNEVRSTVDVGGGSGVLLMSILQTNPELQGIAFDKPSAERECVRRFEDAALSGRARFVGGDFFKSLPAGHDLYLLKSVLHNWDDAAATRLLEVCRQTMTGESRLLVIERVILEGDASAEAKLFDVNMLVTVGGRERTEQEYRRLLNDAQFAVTRLIPTLTPMTIIEAVPQAR